LGPKLLEFEKKFARFIGVKYAVAVNSGTSGLHLCIKSLDIKDGDEVITTPFSFIASANSILFERAKPVFVDIREDILNIDENKIEGKITKRTKAILVVHVFGYPADMSKIMKIAKRHKLLVIEDACEAIGASIEGKKVGSFGDCAVFAFYPNKQMTTGEGGMIVTNNHKIAELARSLRSQGRGSSKWLSHERLGYNYRISELNCALGISQLSRINKILAKRKKVAENYRQAFLKIPRIVTPPTGTAEYQRSWFVYVIRLANNYSPKDRNDTIRYLERQGISCGIYFPAIHLQPFYQEIGFRAGDYPITEKVSARTIALPFFNKLKVREIKFVVNKVKEKVAELNHEKRIS
jgi:perosamine synthetase